MSALRGGDQPLTPADSSQCVRATEFDALHTSTLAGARAASELRDEIEVWVNEGGAGGEEN